MKKKAKYLTVALLILISAAVYSQEFGFGFDSIEEEGASSASSASSSGVSFTAGGEITVEMPLYFRDFDGQDVSFWDMVSGKLNFTLSSQNVEAFASLNLNAWSLDELIYNPNRFLNDPTYTPLFIDEAFLRAYIGPVNIAAGLRKLSWGRMDAQGPLDVTNPVDYSDLRYIMDLRSVKIARPMLHVTWNTGSFSKLEGVFIPNFTGHRFDMTGRWAPNQVDRFSSAMESEITRQLSSKWTGSPLDLLIFSQQLRSGLTGYFSDNIDSFLATDTASVHNFQGGLRFTATLGAADLGLQYFYGKMFRPGFTMSGIDTFVDAVIADPSSAGIMSSAPLLTPYINYTRYHQIGIDYAQVIFGFNVRAEFALHLTQDLKGDDGSVANPFIGWAVGFDRDLFWDINLNIQCDETIRLLNDKIGGNPVFDSQALTDMTSTRVTARLSKAFLMDRLESNLTFIWNIENSDFYIIPSIAWTMGNLTSELTAGIFAGNKDGEFGQYWKNSFIRLGVTYLF